MGGGGGGGVGEFGVLGFRVWGVGNQSFRHLGILGFQGCRDLGISGFRDWSFEARVFWGGVFWGVGIEAQAIGALGMYVLLLGGVGFRCCLTLNPEPATLGPEPRMNPSLEREALNPKPLP